MIKLYKGDCLELMKDIPDKSINLVLIDPPYNIKKAKWDKWKTVNEYVEFMGKVFLEIQRVLKDNGSFYFFHNDFLQMVELQNYINKNTEFIFQSLLTWEKYQTNKQYYGRNILMSVNANEKRNYRSMAEYCLFYTLQDNIGFSKNRLRDSFKAIKDYLKKERLKTGLTINEIGILYNQYVAKPNVKDNRRIVGHYFKDSQWCLPTKEIYENVLQKTGYFQKPYKELEEQYNELRYTYNVVSKDVTTTFLLPPAPKKWHITPKPVDLLEYIIKTSSNENDVVLDCFMGSGSTGVACKYTNRRFIGIELDDNYFEIAKKRIEEE